MFSKYELSSKASKGTEGFFVINIINIFIIIIQ